MHSSSTKRQGARSDIRVAKKPEVSRAVGTHTSMTRWIRGRTSGHDSSWCTTVVAGMIGLEHPIFSTINAYLEVPMVATFNTNKLPSARPRSLVQVVPIMALENTPLEATSKITIATKMISSFDHICTRCTDHRSASSSLSPTSDQFSKKGSTVQRSGVSSGNM